MSLGGNRFARLVGALALGGSLFLAAQSKAQGSFPLTWGINQDLYPVPTNILSNVTAIAAGAHHNLAVHNQRVWAWGDNTFGQTNVPAPALSGVMAVAGGGGFSLALRTNGQVVAWGIPIVATNVPGDLASGVSQIAAGDYHALALKNGRVYAWGSNTFGQCNVPAELTTGVTAVAAGGYFSLALKDGAVHVFGIPATNEYAYGIHDVPAAATSGVEAIAAGQWHGLALKEGRVIIWGASNFFDPTNYLPPAVTSGVVAISAGNLFNMARKADSTLVVWGDDTKGQQPVPPFASTGVTAIAAGDGHCFVLGSFLPPRFIGAVIPIAYSNVLYSNAFIYAAGQPPPTYHKGPTWLSWMTIDPVSGALGGLPLTVGTFPFQVVASNQYGRVTNSYSITILKELLQPPVFISTSPVPSGVVGAPYSHQIVATNGTITYSLVIGEGGLPSGLSMNSSGLITGTPVAVVDPAVFFRVRAVNEVGTTTNTFFIAVNPPAGPPVFVTTNPLPFGVKAQPYSHQVVISNYPTFIGLWSGTLPNGLDLGTNGLLSGTPQESGDFTFTIRATNIVGTTDQEYNLEIRGPPIFLTSSPLPFGVVGVAYTQTIEATAGAVFSLFSGSLPPGLGLTAAGAITGTPTTVGLNNFTVRATNDYGWSNRTFEIFIGAKPAFITTSPLPFGVVSVTYSQTVVATEDPTFSLITGALPAGLHLTPAGAITGVPSTVGISNFTLRATNQYGFDDRAFSLEIGQKPAFVTTSPLPDGVFGAAYSNQIVAEGSPVLVFSLVEGNLHSGLGLSAAGAITGTPVSAGTSNFTVRVTNTFGFADSNFSLYVLVQNPPWFTSIRSTNGGIRLTWTNPNPAGQIQVWRATNIRAPVVNWTNLGVQTSPWTNVAPTLPAYYQLRLVP